tara:strand:+ start:2905 stop:3042 length:138 start_codon:yes stop_codon:yes gene_type:complete
MMKNMKKEVDTWTHMDLAEFYALSEARSDESDAGFKILHTRFRSY